MSVGRLTYELLGWHLTLGGVSGWVCVYNLARVSVCHICGHFIMFCFVWQGRTRFIGSLVSLLCQIRLQVPLLEYRSAHFVPALCGLESFEQFVIKY